MNDVYSWKEKLDMELRAYLFWVCVEYGHCISRDAQYRLISDFDFQEPGRFVEGLLAEDGEEEPKGTDRYEILLKELRSFLLYFENARKDGVQFDT